MSKQNQSGPSSRLNPILWFALAIGVLIAYVLFSGERGASMTREQPTAPVEKSVASGQIERSLLVPPGMRAREYIAQMRDNGKPYPLAQVFDKANAYLREGSLADAHLLYFFAAREDYLPAIMVMGEMSDPTRFSAADSLLDRADVIQAHKWYSKAASLGQQTAVERLEGLRQWAGSEAEAGNPHARQFLLNFQ
jgi:TPR repeat protein